MDHTVVVSLFPVVLLIAIGWAVGRKKWISMGSVKDLSNLVFLVLVPALLFRTMSTVHVENLDFKPVLAYFIGVGVLFLATLAVGGFNRRAAVLALANTFSNTVMIGIPIVSLAYGQEGLVTLMTLYTVHTVILLTSATVVLELAVMREDARAGIAAERHLAMTVLLAVRNAIINPIPLPIILALLFAQTGLTLPPLIDKPLQLLGNAFGPLALLLVGVTLANTPVGTHIRGALGLVMVKNLAHPALVAGAGLALGLGGLPLSVMVVTASLPIGANVFLFSQRYKVAEELITASVVLSTTLALVTIPLVMWGASHL